MCACLNEQTFDFWIYARLCQRRFAEVILEIDVRAMGYQILYHARAAGPHQGSQSGVSLGVHIRAGFKERGDRVKMLLMIAGSLVDRQDNRWGRAWVLFTITLRIADRADGVGIGALLQQSLNRASVPLGRRQT